MNFKSLVIPESTWRMLRQSVTQCRKMEDADEGWDQFEALLNTVEEHAIELTNADEVPQDGG